MERNLVEIVVDDRAPTMRFQHTLIRDAAYGLMSFRQRRALNESIASWYEGPDGGGIVPARLAHHLLEADRPEHALPYLAAAGEQALSSAAYQEASGWFRHAITLGGTDTERATWFAQLGRSERFLGRLHESERALRRSLDLSGVPFPTARRLPGALGRSAWRQASNRLGRQAPQHHAAELVVRVHEDLTSVYYLDNQAVPTIMSVLEQLNAAETLGDAEGMVRGYSTMASTCELLLLSRAAHHYERLAAELLEGCAPRVEAVYHQFIAIHFLGSGGRWDEALSSFGRGQELWDELGEPFLALECQSLRATTEFLCGRGSGHDGLSSAVRERAIASDQDVLEAMACIELAVLANRRGDARAALDHLERPLALGAEVGQIQRVWARAMEAAALHLDAAPESLDAAEACLVEMERLRPLAPYNLDAYSMLADLGTDLLAGGGAPCAGRRARSIARRSTMQLWRFAQSYRIGRPRVLVTLAERRLAAGRLGAAAMLAQRAAASAQRMGMGFDEARAALVNEAAAAGELRVAVDRRRTSALLAAAGDGVQRARVDAIARRGSHRRSTR